MIGNSIPETSPVKQRQALIAAANAGDARSQFLLAERYRIGDEFTERDYSEALKWYGLAAEQGDPDAQNNLGSMFLTGLGVPKDAAKAVTWYRRAAKQGLPVAQFGNTSASLSLATIYERGLGVGQDQARALAWLRWGLAPTGE